MQNKQTKFKDPVRSGKFESEDECLGQIIYYGLLAEPFTLDFSKYFTKNYKMYDKLEISVKDAYFSSVNIQTMDWTTFFVSEFCLPLFLIADKGDKNVLWKVQRYNVGALSAIDVDVDSRICATFFPKILNGVFNSTTAKNEMWPIYQLSSDSDIVIDASGQ